MADDDVYCIHINSKQQMSNYIANEKLPDLQYGYKVSQSISTEKYRDVQSELILNNCLHERADFVANPRASSCEPLLRITIRTLEDLQTEQDRLGIKNFTVVCRKFQPVMFWYLSIEG